MLKTRQKFIQPPTVTQLTKCKWIKELEWDLLYMNTFFNGSNNMDAHKSSAAQRIPFFLWNWISDCRKKNFFFSHPFLVPILYKTASKTNFQHPSSLIVFNKLNVIEAKLEVMASAVKYFILSISLSLCYSLSLSLLLKIMDVIGYWRTIYLKYIILLLT